MTRLTLALAVTFVVAAIVASMPTTHEPPMLPPCPTEDSTGCYWDAQTMGNGIGHDVVTEGR